MAVIAVIVQQSGRETQGTLWKLRELARLVYALAHDKENLLQVSTRVGHTDEYTHILYTHHIYKRRRDSLLRDQAHENGHLPEQRSSAQLAHSSD